PITPMDTHCPNAGSASEVPTTLAANAGSAPACRRRKYADAWAPAFPATSPAGVVLSTLRRAWVVVVLASEAVTIVPEQPTVVASATRAAVPRPKSRRGFQAMSRSSLFWLGVSSKLADMAVMLGQGARDATSPYRCADRCRVFARALRARRRFRP